MDLSENSPDLPPAQIPVFATTHWSVVRAADGSDSPEAQQALERLCQIYWYPLYAFVRRQGKPVEEAQDLTQEFFLRMLKRKDFGKADREKGKFRTYLMTAMKHFLCDMYDWAGAQRRGSGIPPVSLDAISPVLKNASLEAENRYQLEPRDNAAPDQIFERAWAVILIRQAMDKLREEYRAPGKAALFEHLNELKEGESTGLTYAQIGQKIGMTEKAVKAAAHQFRKRFRELFREEIAQTVANPFEVDEEIRYLLRVLGG